MPSLPDPRPASDFPAEPLHDRLRSAWDARAQGRSSHAWTGLVRGVRRSLERGDDDDVVSLLRGTVPGAALLAARAVDDAVNGIGTEEDLALAARVFLMPVLVVTAGAFPAVVPGAVAETGEIVQTMRAAGALGPVESFALSGALGAGEEAAGKSPAALHRFVRAGAAEGGVELLHPAPVEIDSADERVHIRFLAGMSVTAGHAPTFLETAGGVGRWGMTMARLLARQLTPTGVSLLAIPRAPMSWYCAVAEGTFAREEASFNLFATSAIRQIRSSTGDPFAVVSSCSDGTIRIDLRSPFDEMEARSHVWVLDVHHDLDRVERSIVDLLKECRLDDVRLSPEIAAPLPLHPAGLAGRLLS